MGSTNRGFKPKRSFSQNFLVDGNLARKMVDALELAPDSFVIEAGPGKGALTSVLLERGVTVCAVEKDRSLIPCLSGRFGKQNRLKLVFDDILSVDFNELVTGGFGHVHFLSNLPYGITSPVLLRLIGSRYPFRTVVVTMQKEVAARLTAKPGCRDYGRLTVMISLYGKVERLFDLPPGVFRPRPAVVSTCVRIRPDSSSWLDMRDFSLLEAVLRAAFSSRRKKVVNSMASSLGIPTGKVKILLESAGVDPSLRPECISPADFVKVAGLFAAFRGPGTATVPA